MHRFALNDLLIGSPGVGGANAVSCELGVLSEMGPCFSFSCPASGQDCRDPFLIHSTLSTVQVLELSNVTWIDDTVPRLLEHLDSGIEDLHLSLDYSDTIRQVRALFLTQERTRQERVLA